MIVLGASRQPGDRVLRNPPKRIRIWHSLAPDFIAPQWALQRTVTVKRISARARARSLRLGPYTAKNPAKLFAKLNNMVKHTMASHWLPYTSSLLLIHFSYTAAHCGADLSARPRSKLSRVCCQDVCSHPNGLANRPPNCLPNYPPSRQTVRSACQTDCT